MARFKLEALLPSLVADFRALLLELQDYYSPSELTTGDLWTLLRKVSTDRAYDDSHPGFSSGKWKRVLPYDGRGYCFYYIDGANDKHVETLLKATLRQLCAEYSETGQAVA